MGSYIHKSLKVRGVKCLTTVTHLRQHLPTNYDVNYKTNNASGHLHKQGNIGERGKIIKYHRPASKLLFNYSGHDSVLKTPMYINIQWTLNIVALIF